MKSPLALLLAAVLPTGLLLADPISVDTFGPIGTNGSFFNVGTSGTFGENNGWTVTSGNVDVIGGFWQAPPDGLQSVDMDGSSPGAIGTMIAVGVTGNVTVDFYLSANPGFQNPKVLDVSLNGDTQQASYNYVTEGNTDSDMKWTLESLTFDDVTAGSYLLNFASEDTFGDQGPALGEVTASVVAQQAGVPEATPTWVLLGCVLALGALAGRTRLRSAVL